MAEFKEEVPTDEIEDTDAPIEVKTKTKKEE